MSTEIKPSLIIVGGTYDHTDEAKDFYDRVADAFSADFEVTVFLPEWKYRQPTQEAAVGLINELDVEADKVVKKQIAQGGVLLADQVKRPALLGMSVGGVAAFEAVKRNPGKYGRAYAVSARLNPIGVEGLRGINPAGAVMVELYNASRHDLEISRLRTGSPVGGDIRVPLSAATISGVEHDQFPVSRDHIRGITEITTNPAHVQTIARFLKAA